MKSLIISPSAGMCNRLRTICSAIVLGEYLNRRIYHAWFIETDNNFIAHHQPHVKDMQSISLDNLFITQLEMVDKDILVDNCYTEWLSGEYWNKYQSIAQRNLKVKNPFKKIHTNVDVLLDDESDVILIETSLELYLSKYKDEWENKMVEAYQKYFTPLPKYYNIITNLPPKDIAIHMRRTDHLWYVKEANYNLDDVIEWIKKMNGDKVVLCDDLDAKKYVCEKLGISSDIDVGKELSRWEIAFIEFLYMAYKCKKIYGTIGSSFSKQASLLNNVPYGLILS